MKHYELEGLLYITQHQKMYGLKFLGDKMFIDFFDIINQQLRLITNSTLLTGINTCKETNQFVIINSYKSAKILATQQYDVENVWGDIRESNTLGSLNKNEFEIFEAKIQGILFRYLTNINVFEYVGGDVDYDFWQIACIFTNGINHENSAVDFWTNVYFAYKCGGWPCGWIGDYPQGKMAVYDCLNWSS